MRKIYDNTIDMIWQTQPWADMLRTSWQVEQTYVIDGVHIEKRSIAFGQYGLFVLWVAPTLSPERLIALCQQEKCLFLQIETYITDISQESSCFNTLREWYYKKFIPPYTALIDMTQSLDDILAGMKPKGRYNIKLAQKKWVKCQVVEKTPENIKHFYNILLETTTRDAFSGNSFEYYTQFLNTLTSSQLLLAYLDEEVIAGGIFVFDAEVSLYYYGASSNKHRNVMAPYLVQYTALCEAKNRGSRYYDFLWVAWPNEKNSPLAGVTDFKKKFTTDMRHVSQSYIWVRNKPLYMIIQLLRKLSR